MVHFPASYLSLPGFSLKSECKLCPIGWVWWGKNVDEVDQRSTCPGLGNCLHESHLLWNSKLGDFSTFLRSAISKKKHKMHFQKKDWLRMTLFTNFYKTQKKNTPCWFASVSLRFGRTPNQAQQPSSVTPNRPWKRWFLELEKKNLLKLEKKLRINSWQPGPLGGCAPI